MPERPDAPARTALDRPSAELAAPSSAEPGRRKWLGDALMGVLTRGSALLLLAMALALVGLLVKASLPSLQGEGGASVLGATWRANELTETLRDEQGDVVVDDAGDPVERVTPPAFGALPAIQGTIVTSAIALVIAVPLSLGAALFIVRIAPRWRVATPMAFMVEFLAAIPSIGFGMWGLFVLAPFLREHVYPLLKGMFYNATTGTWTPGTEWLFQTTQQVGPLSITRDLPLNGIDVLCGGLVLAIMIIPIITAVARDVLAAVPRAQIEGTLALGATWWQSAAGMLRYGRSGLFGGVMLGLARAAGETMAVTLVIGNAVRVFSSPLDGGTTMSSLLASQFNEASTEQWRSALMFIALVLLGMSLVFNVIARSLIVGRSARSSSAH